MNAKIKFVQIAVCHVPNGSTGHYDNLYALADDGSVWLFKQAGYQPARWEQQGDAKDIGCPAVH